MNYILIDYPASAFSLSLSGLNLQITFTFPVIDWVSFYVNVPPAIILLDVDALFEGIALSYYK